MRSEVNVKTTDETSTPVADLKLEIDNKHPKMTAESVAIAAKAKDVTKPKPVDKTIDNNHHIDDKNTHLSSLSHLCSSYG